VELSIKTIGDVHVLHLRGRFAIGKDVDEFRSTTESLMKDGVFRIVLNMADVPMMDSSAIGTVVRLTASTKKDGGDVRLVAPSKMVVQTLKIVGLLNIFEIYADEQAAAQSFSYIQAAPAVPPA